MQLFTPADPRPIHFMGIGGAGMSALALIASQRGVTVTGCDLNPRGASDLVRAGVRVNNGHDPSHVAGARAVVHTAAVPTDHPELVAAREAGVAVVRRADALWQVVERGTVVAISGTHGKTTTTAMTTEALMGCGANPTGIVGGRVAAWEGNVRIGGDDVFVVEADEYDKAFLALRPTIAVINNVEADHLECYGSLSALEAAFAEFAAHADQILVGWDDPGARRVAAAIDRPVTRVGVHADADVRITETSAASAGSSARLVMAEGREVALTVAIPGMHNVRNAAMAVGVAVVMGYDAALAGRSLEGFLGVGRRFEILGRCAGITVVDDYAHHPTEVSATLAAARQRFPGARVVAVFQPHLFSRTQLHGEALGTALAAADVALVTAIYPAREAPIPGVTGAVVADAARLAGAVVEWTPDRKELVKRISELVREGDVVLTLGAGDITDVGPELLHRLAETAA